MTIAVDRKRRRKMDVSTSSYINSKAASITSILLNAWRNKLSNEEWEAKIHRILPRGVTGDVYDLAKCILDQALVGPVPNSLFISYLKHAINCELVSHGSVLATIYEQFDNNGQFQNRTLSINCLLNLIDENKSKIFCKGNETDCINLCQSLCLVIHILFKCIKTSLTVICNSPQNFMQQATTQQLTSSNIAVNNNNNNLLNSPLQEYLKIISLSTNLVEYFNSNPFYKSLLFIGKIEFTKEFTDLSNTMSLVHKILSQNAQLRNHLKDNIRDAPINKLLDKSLNSTGIHPTIVAAQQLKCVLMSRPRPTCTTLSYISKQSEFDKLLRFHDSTTTKALFDLLYSLIAFDVVLKPAKPVRLLAEQISTIANFVSAPLHDTFCELIRICMIGTVRSDGSSEKIKWTHFTFLKLPKLFENLHKLNDNFYVSDIKTLQNEPSSGSQQDAFLMDLKLALRKLCDYSPFLDEADEKFNGDFLSCFLKELIKLDPSLAPLKALTELRIQSAARPVTTDSTGIELHMMLKVVTSVLKTLESKQNPAQLFNLLCQLLYKNSFESIISAAASTGRLQIFIRRLIEHNTCTSSNESTANENIDPFKALIFDLTFLMLTYIAHHYGPDVIISQENQSSTFIKWYYDCYNVETRINCPFQMLKNCDKNIINDLIGELLKPMNGNGTYVDSISLVKFKKLDDLCHSIPVAIKEVLNAWQCGLLDDTHINAVVERIRSKMCSLAVIAASWLHCYIKTLDSDDCSKPLQLLQGLTKASQIAKQHPQFFWTTVKPIENLEMERYTDRSALMRSITRKIYFELSPTSTASPSASNTSPKNNSVTIQQKRVGTNSEPIEESPNNETPTHHSVYGKFISTLWSHEILKENVSQCLRRGWIDSKSLHSLNSVFKLMGAERFTNFMVDNVISTLESPSDLKRSINISFSLFHLDIEACAIALLKEVIPSYMLQDKKQEFLNQPRALALAQLSAMSIFSALNYLRKQFKLSQNQHTERPIVNEFVVKMETKELNTSNLNDSYERPAKRIKSEYSNECGRISNAFNNNNDFAERIQNMDECIVGLMQILHKIMADRTVSQRTLFPLSFLKQTVVCAREGNSYVTKFLQPETLLDIIEVFSSELSFEMAISISNLHSSRSRRITARAMCRLAQIKDQVARQIPFCQASSGFRSNELGQQTPQLQAQNSQQTADGNKRSQVGFTNSSSNSNIST